MTNEDIKQKIRNYVPAATIKTQEDEVIEYMNAKFPGTKVTMKSQFVRFAVEDQIPWLDLRAIMTSLDAAGLVVESPCADCGPGMNTYIISLGG